MKLKTKLIHITDATGNDIDVSTSNCGLYLNGKKHTLSLPDVIRDWEYDDGEIYGNTLLSFYNVTDDGKLFVAGSEIELRNDKGEQIKVTKITRPGIHDDTTISFEEVQKFVFDFEIENPEEVFPDLNDEEKQVLIAQRETNEATTRKQKSDADKALQDAEADRLAKEKETADKELRASLPTETVFNESAYREVKAFYKGKSTEHISDPYHVWYGKNEEPCLFIKRGTSANSAWWEQPKQLALEGETSNELVIEFNDLGKERELVFNMETKEIELKKEVSA